MMHACIAEGCKKIVGGKGFVKSCLEPHRGSKPHLEFCNRRHPTAMASGESHHCDACHKEDMMMESTQKEINQTKALLEEKEATELKNGSDIRRLKHKLEGLKKAREDAQKRTDQATGERKIGYNI
ncbi:hypothetical protein RUND412_010992 [Rhizina undulata]